MIPWLLCIWIYHVALLHYFISTNNTCVMVVLPISIHSFKEVPTCVKPLYRSFCSSLFYIYMFPFHRLLRARMCHTHSCTPSSCWYGSRLLAVTNHPQPAVPSLLPTVHSSVKTWCVSFIPNELFSFCLFP